MLSFENLSADPQQEYFADGVVEDIITGLARINWLSVIARNSTFTYKGKANDIEQVRKDLGVRYVLKGSIRRSSDRVRIVAQLIETRSGVHLWAERYDRSLDDIFAVQDEIAMSVIGAIEPNLRKAEIERVKRKRPESLDAYDLVLRALPFVHKWMPDGAADAIPLLKKALEIEPGYTLAHALLARCFHFRFSRAGLRVPDDCSVIGFDDVPPSGLAVPALTTVRQPMEALGAAAVGIVLEGINAAIEERESSSVQRLLAPELVVRDTTRAI